MKSIFNLVELGRYRVNADIEHTFLKMSQEHTAYLVTSFGIRYILMGYNVMDVKYFDSLLFSRCLERIFEKDM